MSDCILLNILFLLPKSDNMLGKCGILCLFTNSFINHLSYDVASGSEITPCNKICKPLVVYRFSGNVMTSITTLRT